VQVEPIPQEVQEKIEVVESADLVVGVLAELNPESLVILCDALRTLSGSPRIAVLRDDHAVDPAVNIARTNSETAEKCAATFLVPWPLLRPDTPDTPMLSMSAAYQSVFAASEKLEMCIRDSRRTLNWPLLCREGTIRESAAGRG